MKTLIKLDIWVNSLYEYYLEDSFLKKILYIIMAITLMACLAGCGVNDDSSAKSSSSSAEDDGTISVVATIFPQYDFVRQVAGDKVELTMLLSPGSESHSYEPTPQDIIKIQNADVFIYVGGESDEWVKGILDSMDTSDMQLISLMDIAYVVVEEHVEGMQGGDSDEEEAEYDEHIWTSPVNAIKVVDYITDTLSDIDSANENYYRENAEAYTLELTALDKQFREVVYSGVRDTIIFADRFPLRYFADEYGLTYYAAFPGCSTETEASAATVAFLIDKVNDEEIPVVFYIELSNEKMADTIAESTGAEKRLFHSCHNITKADFDAGVTYLELMQQNVENLREALN